MEEPGLTDIHPPRSKTPRRGRRDTSAERGLAKVGEAHQRALATTAALEEEIEQLSWSITRGQLEAHAHSRSQDCCKWKSWGQNRRCHLVQLEESHAPYFKYNPPWRVQHLKKMKRLSWILTWKLHQSWDQRLTASSRGQLKAQGRRMGGCPPLKPLWRI